MTPIARSTGAASRSWSARRTGLIVPVIILVVSVVLFVGTATMRVPSTATFPGPQVFPLIVAIGASVVAVLLAADVIRHPEPPYTRTQAAAEGIDGRTRSIPAVQAAGLDAETLTDDDVALRPQSDVRALVGLVGTLVVFIAALQPVGWLISCAFLFWGVARSLGSRRTIGDVFLALAVSAIVQIAFSAGLGLYLPPGILEGALSWIR